MALDKEEVHLEVLKYPHSCSSSLYMRTLEQFQNQAFSCDIVLPSVSRVLSQAK